MDSPECCQRRLLQPSAFQKPANPVICQHAFPSTVRDATSAPAFATPAVGSMGRKVVILSAPSAPMAFSTQHHGFTA